VLGTVTVSSRAFRPPPGAVVLESQPCLDVEQVRDTEQLSVTIEDGPVRLQIRPSQLDGREDPET
jgi:hypothetical protein